MLITNKELMYLYENVRYMTAEQLVSWVGTMGIQHLIFDLTDQRGLTTDDGQELTEYGLRVKRGEAK